MKTIGLIGGTTWNSTVDYYRLINEMTNNRLGGMTSAQAILYSVNFQEYKELADAGNWDQLGKNFSEIAQLLEQGGAHCILMCANTSHIVADVVQQNIHIPLIHIAEETAKEIVAQKLKTVSLLGTKFTMEHPAFKDRLSRYGITAITPSDSERDYIHTSIFGELGKGILKAETKKRYLEIIESQRQKGAEGTIFGCTEIPLLLKQSDCTTPVFDTTMIHAKAAVEFALGK